MAIVNAQKVISIPGYDKVALQVKAWLLRKEREGGGLAIITTLDGVGMHFTDWETEAQRSTVTHLSKATYSLGMKQSGLKVSFAWLYHQEFNHYTHYPRTGSVGTGRLQDGSQIQPRCPVPSSDLTGNMRHRCAGMGGGRAVCASQAHEPTRPT